MDRIIESGIIGTDGRLRLPMDRINQFVGTKKGMRVIATFQVVEPGTSAAQLAYFYNYILPTCQLALKYLGNRFSERQTEIFLLDQYGCEKESARYFTQPQMSDFIDWLKQYAAENLSVYIEDSQTL